MLNKEQPRKEIPQRKSFAPNYGSDRWLFPPLNNIECFVCHNLGHVAARCRSRMVQDHHTRSSHSSYFRGYCFACNAFGHKEIDCKRRNMKYVRCYTWNKLGHKARECRSKFQNSKQEDYTSSQFQELKKTELETERCDVTQLADITDIGNWKWRPWVFHLAYADIMKISRVYKWSIGCRVTYMEFKRKGSKTDSGKGLVMICNGWHMLRGSI